MKKLILLITLLFSLTAFADVANVNVEAPKFRADNITPITLSELKEYIIIIDGTPLPTRMPVSSTSNITTYTFTPTKTVVLTFIVTDMQDRPSDPSIPITVGGNLAPGAPIVTYTLTIDVSGNVTVSGEPQ